MTTHSVTIRPFRVEDCYQALAIASDLGLSHWTLKDYRDEIAHPASIMIAAEQSGKLEGFIIGRCVPGSRTGDRDAEIYNIGVAETAQRSGVGSGLIEAFIEQCRRAGVRDVWLEVRSANANAIRFYKKKGFKEYSVRRNFYRDPSDDGIIMMLRLGDAILNIP